MLSMATPKPQSTHKHRNIIDDLLDGALILVAMGYYFLSDVFGFHLSDKTLVLMAASGATFRGVVRRILMRLWGEKLGLTAGAEDAQSTPVASNGAQSED